MMAAHEKSLTHHITDDPAAHGVGGLFRIQFRFQIASQGIMGECGVYDEVQHLAGGLFHAVDLHRHHDGAGGGCVFIVPHQLSRSGYLGDSDGLRVLFVVC